MSRVRVSFPPQAMKTTHAGLDLEASAARYRDALEQALESALANVPELPGRTIVAVDVSGARRVPAPRRGVLAEPAPLPCQPPYEARIRGKN